MKKRKIKKAIDKAIDAMRLYTDARSDASIEIMIRMFVVLLDGLPKKSRKSVRRRMAALVVEWRKRLDAPDSDNGGSVNFRGSDHLGTFPDEADGDDLDEEEDEAGGEEGADHCRPNQRVKTTKGRVQDDAERVILDTLMANGRCTISVLRGAVYNGIPRLKTNRKGYQQLVRRCIDSLEEGDRIRCIGKGMSYELVMP